MKTSICLTLIIAIIFATFCTGCGHIYAETEATSIATEAFSTTTPATSVKVSAVLYTPTKYGTGIDFPLPDNNHLSSLSQEINYMANLLLYGIGIQPNTYNPTDYFYAPIFINYEVDQSPPDADAEWYTELLKYELTSVDGHTYNLTVLYSMRQLTCKLTSSSLRYHYTIFDAGEIYVHESYPYQSVGIIKIPTKEFIPTQTPPTETTIPQREKINDSLLIYEANQYFYKLTSQWEDKLRDGGLRNASASVYAIDTKIIARTDDIVTIECTINCWLKGGNPTATFTASAMFDVYTGKVLFTNFNPPF